MAVSYKVAEDGYTHPIPDDCPPALAELLKECWASEPTDRPSFAVIVETLEKMKC